MGREPGSLGSVSRLEDLGVKWRQEESQEIGRKNTERGEKPKTPNQREPTDENSKTHKEYEHQGN